MGYMREMWHVMRDAWRRPLQAWLRPFRQLTVASIGMVIGMVLTILGHGSVEYIGLAWVGAAVMFMQDAVINWTKWKLAESEKHLEQARMFIFTHAFLCRSPVCVHPSWMHCEDVPVDRSRDEAIRRHTLN